MRRTKAEALQVLKDLIEDYELLEGDPADSLEAREALVGMIWRMRAAQPWTNGSGFSSGVQTQFVRYSFDRKALGIVTNAVGALEFRAWVYGSATDMSGGPTQSAGYGHMRDGLEVYFRSTSEACRWVDGELRKHGWALIGDQRPQ